MEYKCDICGAPASVHITKIIDGKKIKMHLCAACAEKNSALASAGFPADIIPNIKKLEEQLLSAGNPSKADLICPNCGGTFEEFEKRGRFSCPSCYEAFRDKLTELLAQMHGALSHVGKRPKRHAKQARASEEDSRQTELPLEGLSLGGAVCEPTFDDIAQGLIEESKGVEMPDAAMVEESKKDLVAALKAQLESAISDERYEDAAAIRDKIKDLESEE